MGSLSAPSLSAIPFGNLNPQRLDLSEQGARVDAQLLGSHGTIPSMPTKRLFNEYFLHGFEARTAQSAENPLAGVVPEILRQMLQLNQAILAEYEGMFDDVLEFSNIARIVVFHENDECFFSKAGHLFVLQPVVSVDEMVYEERDILSTLPQAGHIDVHYVNAVEQILAKPAFADELS